MITTAGQTWNPRYVIYATTHGHTPDQQLEHDLDFWPGGKMTGFILWTQAQWDVWFKQRQPPLPESERDYFSLYGDEFDCWLTVQAALGQLARLPAYAITPEPGSCVPGSDPGTR